uniref:Chaperone clpb, putative n=1 Tax=Arundo donax TaxID=35708 RepID=A0A0A9HQF2_ARUDO
MYSTRGLLAKILQSSQCPMLSVVLGQAYQTLTVQ